MPDRSDALRISVAVSWLAAHALSQLTEIRRNVDTVNFRKIFIASCLVSKGVVLFERAGG
jgi:hypothetical protein